MSRRRGAYSMPKLKLKQKTVVSIATVSSFVFAFLSTVALTTHSEYLSFWRAFLFQNIGWTSIFAPLAFALNGLVLMKLKWKYAQVNTLLGLIAMMLGLMGLTAMVSPTQGGDLGTFMASELQPLITTWGEGGLFLAILVAGIVVFFNTSLDQIFGVFSNVGSGVAEAGKSVGKVGSVLPRPAFDREVGPIKLSGIDDRPQGGKMPPTPASQKEPIAAETLVQNVAGQARVWHYPPLSLLSDKGGAPADRGDIKKNAAIIERTLDSFGIQARVAEVNGGPAVTQYALEIAQGTKIAKIANLQHDIALALATRTGTVRIEAPIPGKSLVGIEVPNHTLEVVTLKSVIGSDEIKKTKSKTAVPLGKDTASHPVIVDISKMPHVLVAGTTGSGKSILMHQWISSLIMRNSPDELKMILIDPKRVEMTMYNGIPHLLSPVIVEPEKILSALKWAMGEMDRRYKQFQSVGVRNIQAYNEMSGFQALPYIVIFIDELADLMMFAPVEVEDAITRIAQLARATGIHLVIATQRPSVDVITGLMKANIPARIAFNVASLIDSRVIIDSPGAEKLLGRGDMLFMSPDAAKPIRIQGVLVTDPEIKSITNFLREQGIAPQYTAEVTEMPVTIKGKGSVNGVAGSDQDPLFEEAVRTVCQYDRASASLLQRRLKVGYARAARIIDELEMAGVIGAGDGAKPRDVLVRNADDYFVQQAPA